MSFTSSGHPCSTLFPRFYGASRLARVSGCCAAAAQALRGADSYACDADQQDRQIAPHAVRREALAALHRGFENAFCPRFQPLRDAALVVALGHRDPSESAHDVDARRDRIMALPTKALPLTMLLSTLLHDMAADLATERAAEISAPVVD